VDALVGGRPTSSHLPPPTLFPFTVGDRSLLPSSLVAFSFALPRPVRNGAAITRFACAAATPTTVYGSLLAVTVLSAAATWDGLSAAAADGGVARSIG
jgi:hypothetical protein